MYTRYFGLTEKPFAIAPNPRYLYMSELHREALAHLLYGISSDGCIILLTGDVGTGKTTVCRCLLEQLPQTTDVALILNPKLTITDLLKTICEELKIGIDEGKPTVKTYVDSINRHLLQAHGRGRNTALIIDEAQNIDIEVMEQLRLLTNLETNTHKLLQIVLIGQPELQKILGIPQLSQINQRITTRYHLKPLQTRDIQAYIQHRLTIAGGINSTRLFTKSAISYIARISGGIPRVINVLCDRALLGAYAENRTNISRKIVKKAAREVVAITSRNQTPATRKLVVVALCLLALSLPVSIYLISQGSLGDNIRQVLPFVEQQEPLQTNKQEPETIGKRATEPPQAINRKD